MDTILPVAVIGGGLYVLLRSEQAAAQTPQLRDEMIHPYTSRLRPPPLQLKDNILTPAWGQRRFQPYKAFPAPGGLTDHLFVHPVTGQVLTAQQNAGFEAC